MAKAAASPPPKVGIRKSDRSNSGCSARLSTSTNSPRNTAARTRQIDDAAVAPGNLAGADQAVDQADQAGGQCGETGPVRSRRVRRLGLVDLPPGDGQRSHADRQVDQEDAPPADACRDHAAQHRSESDGDTGHGAPDAECDPTLVAVERLGQKGERSGEEDRTTDALGAAGQDQHQRGLGHAAEQGTQGEDDRGRS